MDRFIEIVLPTDEDLDEYDTRWWTEALAPERILRRLRLLAGEHDPSVREPEVDLPHWRVWVGETVIMLACQESDIMEVLGHAEIDLIYTVPDNYTSVVASYVSHHPVSMQIRLKLLQFYHGPDRILYYMEAGPGWMVVTMPEDEEDEGWYAWPGPRRVWDPG